MNLYKQQNPQNEEHEPLSWRTVKDKLIDLYYDINSMIGINFMWFLFSGVFMLTYLILESLIGLPDWLFYVALAATFVGGAPATVAVAYAQQQGAHEASISIRTYFEGLQENWKFSYLWGVVTVLVFFIPFNAFKYYQSLGTTWSFVLAYISLGVLVIWALIQLYLLPMYFEIGEEKDYQVMLRNCLVLLFARPLLSLSLVVVNLIILFLSQWFIPLWIFISMALIWYINSRAMVKSIAHVNEKAAEYQEEKENNQG